MATGVAAPVAAVAGGLAQGCVGCNPATPWHYYWLPPQCRELHMAYPRVYDGWYYFRPYSVGQLQALQEATASWGGDPRNPCSNEIFQRVYQDIEPSLPSPPNKLK